MLRKISGLIKNGIIIIYLELLLRISSQQIIYPLKMINSTFSKYKKAENIFIKTSSLSNINCFNSLKKNIFTETPRILSSKIDILNSMLFATEIEIGSNSQKFNVILDTGSQILWVPEINSTVSNPEIKNFYEPEKSKTSKNIHRELEVVYGTGYCQGYFYKDLIKFLSNDKYYLFFGSANNSIFDVEGSEGILGLARTYPNDSLSPMLTLKNNGIIESASFSFKYDKIKNELYMYAGKPHKDFETKNIPFCNLLSNNNYEKILWACELNNFGFIKNSSKLEHEENIFTKTNTSIIFDTGTNSIILPYDLIFALKEKIKKYNCVLGSSASTDSDDATAFVICFDVDRIPDIGLQFGDYILVLNRYKMFYAIDFGFGITGYLLNVQFQKNLWTAIIGQNFFTEFHTLFDPENKVLKFYSDSKDKIIWIKQNNNGENNIGIIFILLILIILVAGCIFYRYLRKNNSEYNYNWMGPNDEINSKFNNISLNT